jgi:hypothetical protein
MRWGLIPRWWKKSLKELPATFNARAETVVDKPIFRDAFRRSRFLISASGYYEWQTVGKNKQPYYFTPRNGPVLTFAGCGTGCAVTLLRRTFVAIPQLRLTFSLWSLGCGSSGACSGRIIKTARLTWGPRCTPG